MNVNATKDKLVSDISENDKIKGIGQTGAMNADLIPGNSDIDMFVLCTTIPSEAERKSVYLCPGTGLCDFYFKALGPC